MHAEISRIDESLQDVTNSVKQIEEHTNDLQREILKFQSLESDVEKKYNDTAKRMGNMMSTLESTIAQANTQISSIAQSTTELKRDHYALSATTQSLYQKVDDEVDKTRENFNMVTQLLQTQNTGMTQHMDELKTSMHKKINDLDKKTKQKIAELEQKIERLESSASST
uniref:LO4 n=1 Tax=Bueycito anole adomavirus TaxID=2609873 RepID=A0A6F9F5I9_9VIRU|nr:TPA_asm: LO4 [Bueycito anole adomavirus]